MRIKLRQLILLLGDIFFMYLSLYFALLLRGQNTSAGITWANHLYSFTIVFFMWVLVFYIMNLYNLYTAENNSSFLKLATNGFVLSTLLSTLFFYLNPDIGVAPKTNLVMFVLVYAVIFSLWRLIFNYILKTHLPKKKIAIIGYNELTREVLQTLTLKPHLGYKVSFVVNSENKDLSNLSVPVVNDIHTLPEIVSVKEISTILLASSPHRSDDLRTTLFSCLPHNVTFVNLTSFYESISGKVPIDDINQMWFLENLNEGNKKWFDIFKRIYDLVLAIFILFVTIIFWPLIGLLIRLNSPGSVFFIQTRAGKYGKKFKMVKFRTMSVSDNDYKPTEENDTRVTRLGLFLRKTRIDEIPQILNVIRGEMSFVGPRPERPELIKELEKNVPFYHERMLVKPGLSGWDQISGEYHSPSVKDTLKKLQYDLFYIKNRSVYLDLSIILKTIATILSRAGV